MGSAEVKDYLENSFFLFADLSQLIVEQYIVISEPIDGSEVHIHAIPGDLFEFFGEYFVFEDFYSTGLLNFFAVSK